VEPIGSGGGGGGRVDGGGQDLVHGDGATAASTSRGSETAAPASAGSETARGAGAEACGAARRCELGGSGGGCAGRGSSWCCTASWPRLDCGRAKGATEAALPAVARVCALRRAGRASTADGPKEVDHEGDQLLIDSSP
jgi:hypothetical protein